MKIEGKGFKLCPRGSLNCPNALWANGMFWLFVYVFFTYMLIKGRIHTVISKRNNRVSQYLSTLSACAQCQWHLLQSHFDLLPTYSLASHLLLLSYLLVFIYLLQPSLGNLKCASAQTTDTSVGHTRGFSTKMTC